MYCYKPVKPSFGLRDGDPGAALDQGLFNDPGVETGGKIGLGNFIEDIKRAMSQRLLTGIDFVLLYMLQGSHKTLERIIAGIGSQAFKHKE